MPIERPSVPIGLWFAPIEIPVVPIGIWFVAIDGKDLLFAKNTDE